MPIAPLKEVVGDWRPVPWNRNGPHDPTHFRIWERVEVVGMSQRHEWRYEDGTERAEDWIYVPFRRQRPTF